MVVNLYPHIPSSQDSGSQLSMHFTFSPAIMYSQNLASPTLEGDDPREEEKIPAVFARENGHKPSPQSASASKRL